MWKTYLVELLVATVLRGTVQQTVVDYAVLRHVRSGQSYGHTARRDKKNNIKHNNAINCEMSRLHRCREIRNPARRVRGESLGDAVTDFEAK